MQKKVLVVDDSLLLHRIFALALGSYEPCEIEVLFAQSGYEGLARLHEHPDTDLILLDINMATMSGLEFLHRVKGERAFRDIAVILETTEDRSHDIARGLEAGARGYLPKPFTPQQLHAVLDDVFGVAAGGDGPDSRSSGGAT